MKSGSSIAAHNEPKSRPRATVAVLNWNCGHFIRECLESVFNQTEPSIEIIVVDNGSSDGSLDEIGATLAHTSIPYRVFSLESNRGACGGLQVALDAANGNYFVPLASDDVMLPHRVQLQCDQLEHSPNGASIAAGAMRLIDADSRVITNIFRRPLVKKPPQYGNPDQARMFAQMGKVPSGPCLAFRTDALRAIGGFDPSVPLEDLYSVLRLVLGAQATVTTTNEVVTLYRRHSRNSGKVPEFTKTPVEDTIRRLIDLGIDFGSQTDHWKRFLQRSEANRASNSQPLSASIENRKAFLALRTNAWMITTQRGMPLYRRARALAAFVFPQLATRWISRSWGDAQPISKRKN